MSELIKDILSKYYSTILGDGDGKADALIKIGSQDKFVPNINASKWSDEAWINLNYEAISVESQKEFLTDGIVSIKVDGTTFKSWVLNQSVLECSLIFDSIEDIPVNNKLEFEIKDSGNLSYFYQPPLTQSEIDEGCKRPDNVVGSYAVYLNKKHNQYKTGKFCHIYRWHFVDKNGKTEWCERIYVEDGQLIIPVPDLSDMIFPVYAMGAGDTLGYNVIGGSTYTADPRTRLALLNADGSSPVAGSTGGATTNVLWYAGDEDGNDWNAETECGIYDDSGSYPNNLLDSAVKSSGFISPGWNSVTVNVQVQSGNTYYPAFSYSGTGYGTTYYDYTPGTNYHSYTNNYGLPDPWSGIDVGFAFSVYMEWTPSGGTSVAPTTLAPTSLAPTSLAPTTLPSTTLPPTTLAPTTLEPTTLPPTTVAPTTPEPTTLPPTTLAPTTLEPTTLAPTTLPPTTIEPTTIAPTTIPGTTLPPTTLLPTTLAPTTIGPTTISPTTPEPTTPITTTLAPTTVGPTTEAPTTLFHTTPAPATTLTTLAPTTVFPGPIARRRGIKDFGFSFRDRWRN